MRKRRLLGLLLLSTLLFACNFPPLTRSARATETAAAMLPTTTPTTSLPSPTPTTELLGTATPTVVPTPSVPEVTPNAANVNCRSGPDVAYDSVAILVSGTTTEVAGRLADSSWWYVHDPSDSSSFCWISSAVVTLLGPKGNIPVQVPPPAIANKVTVKVTIPSTITCGQPNPVEFSGTISTNGPATVQYQWEITGDKTDTTSPQTLTFSDAGTQDAASPGAYNVDCGKYTITLHVTSPNSIKASKDFKVAGP